MRHILGLLALVAGISLLAPISAQADSNPIKMLPPTGCGSTPGTYGLLTWDGVDPLGCINGLTTDGSGDVTISGVLNTGPRLFGQPDGANNFWLGVQGTGTDAQRTALGFNANPGTGAVNYLVTHVPIWLNFNDSSTLVGTACNMPGAIQYDSSTDSVVYCSNKTGEWGSMGGSDRTWHSMPTSYIAGQNTTGHEMVIAYALDANGNGGYAWMNAGPCGQAQIRVATAGITKGAWGYNYGMEATIPAGWCFAGGGSNTTVQTVSALY